MNPHEARAVEKILLVRVGLVALAGALRRLRLDAPARDRNVLTNDDFGRHAGSHLAQMTT